MSTLDSVVSPQSFRVSAAVTMVIAGWFALTFAITVVGLLLGT